LESFESEFEKSMMRSPEAAKVISSYMQDQYPTAIDYMKRIGKMNEAIANAMHAKEQAERLQLESLAREAEYRMEMEAQNKNVKKLREISTLKCKNYNQTWLNNAKITKKCNDV